MQQGFLCVEGLKYNLAEMVAGFHYAEEVNYCIADNSPNAET
jgi:hypothetical protein